MQAVVSAADPWTPGGSRSGWAGLTTVVRVLAAVVLLGVALLLVALVNQTAASADSLPTPPADGPDSGLLSTPPARGSGSATSPNAASPASAGANVDYVRELARGAVVTAKLPPSAAADVRLAQHTGAGEQDRGGSGTPGPDAARLQAPQLGEAVRWGTPKVAQLPKSIGDGTGNAPQDEPPSAPEQPAGTLTVAQAQAPTSPDAGPPSTYRSMSFYLFTNGILQQTEDLRDLIVGDRKDLPPDTMMKNFADRATALSDQIASARKLAGAETIEAGVTVADAPQRALDQAKVATRDLRNLSWDAKYVAKYMYNDEAGKGSFSLRLNAQSAGRTAEAAEHQLATLEEPNAAANNYSRTAPGIVYPVSREAVYLAEYTPALARRWGNRTAWVEDVKREAARLLNDEQTHATNAQGLWVTPTPEQAAQAVKAAAATLRTQADLAVKVADDLDSRGKAIWDLAESAATQADRINIQVFGVAPATPAFNPPVRPRWQEGTDAPAPGPDPDTPVTRDAHLDSGSGTGTPVATVEGRDDAIPERGEEQHVDAAHEQPVGALDASSGTSPFDNSGMFADVPGDTTTFANTG